MPLIGLEFGAEREGEKEGTANVAAVGGSSSRFEPATWLPVKTSAKIAENRWPFPKGEPKSREPSSGGGGALGMEEVLLWIAIGDVGGLARCEELLCLASCSVGTLSGERREGSSLVTLTVDREGGVNDE
jgi:hypothetical protein